MQKFIKTNPVLAMIIANILLAGNSVLAKVAFESLPVMVYIGVRYFLVGSVFLLLALHGRQFFKKGAKRHLAFNAAAQIAFTFSWLIGVNMSQAINAAILFLLTPVIVYVASVVFLKEPRSNRALAGSLIALVGGLVLFGAPAVSSTDPKELAGNGLILLSVFLLAGMVVHTKYLYKYTDLNTIIGSRFTLLGIAGFGVALAQNDFSSVTSISISSMIAVILSVTLAGFFGLQMFYKALQNMKAEDSASLFYVDPLTGAILSALVLGETLSSGTIVAASIIVVGVLVSHPVHVNRMHYYQALRHSRFEEFMAWIYHGYKSLIKTAKKTI